MAVGDAHVFPGFLSLVLTQLSVQIHQLLFSHASAEVRGENSPKNHWWKPSYNATEIMLKTAFDTIQTNHLSHALRQWGLTPLGKVSTRVRLGSSRKLT